MPTDVLELLDGLDCEPAIPGLERGVFGLLPPEVVVLEVLLLALLVFKSITACTVASNRVGFLSSIMSDCVQTCS